MVDVNQTEPYAPKWEHAKETDFFRNVAITKPDQKQVQLILLIHDGCNTQLVTSESLPLKVIIQGPTSL